MRGLWSPHALFHREALSMCVGYGVWGVGCGVGKIRLGSQLCLLCTLPPKILKIVFYNCVYKDKYNPQQIHYYVFITIIFVFF